MSPIQRVPINVDLDWHTEFIPWLEGMERNKIGVEDGAFVATVDPALRVLQPEAEGTFILECLQKRLSSVSTLALKQFSQKGIYQFSATTTENVEEFKETLNLHCYKTDTCCTSILKQCGDIENVFNHLECEVFTKYADVDNGSSFSSRVLLDESGLIVEQIYNKFSKNTQGFQWEKMQKDPPQMCPQSECNYKDDEMEGETEGIIHCKRKAKKQKKSPEDNGAAIYYGYAFESPDSCLQITAKLNLSRIFNLLWLIPYHYPGLHSPYLYFGTTHSFFPVHVEDGLTLSLNYLHVGHPKVWVIIPPWATELLEFHLQKSCILLYHTSCRNLLGHKSVLPTLSWLKERKIPFNVVVQRPGDLVVLYPSSAHFGFNMGPNIAQAINVANKAWIPWGLNAKKCRCLLDAIHIDMSPLVAAFRKDLISHLMHGGTVVTPEMLRGMQLVRDVVVKSSTVLEDKPEYQRIGQGHVTLECPVEKCKKTFSDSPVENAKKNMIKHVKCIHKPVIDSCQLLLKIDKIFDAVAKK